MKLSVADERIGIRNSKGKTYQKISVVLVVSNESKKYKYRRFQVAKAITAGRVKLQKQNLVIWHGVSVQNGQSDGVKSQKKEQSGRVTE